MPKRKSTLGYVTRAAKRNRSARENETDEDRNDRLLQNRSRIALQRLPLDSTTGMSNDISAEGECDKIQEKVCGLSQNLRQITSRNVLLDCTTGRLNQVHATRENETSQERAIRLSKDRSRHSSKIASETPAEREARLAIAKNKMTFQRQRETLMETSIEKETRLAVARNRKNFHREGEMLIQTEARLALDRARHRNKRDLKLNQNSTASLPTDKTLASVHRGVEVTAENVYKESQLTTMTRLFNRECSAMMYNSNIDYRNDDSVSLGPMKNVCQFCLALKWKDESKGMCCQQGKVKLGEILPPPDPLNSLLSGQHPLSKEFLTNIRSYNSAFQMTSFMGKQIVEGGFMPTFKVQGQVYHLAGSVLPTTPNCEKFLQIYFISDCQSQAATRCNNVRHHLNINIVTLLQDMLHIHNSYVLSFKTALENVPPNISDFDLIIHADRRPAGEHRGRYNSPATSEVAVLIVGQEFEKRDIVLHSRTCETKKISETHRSYDSLQYPLMLPRGEDGYFISIPQINPQTGENLTKTVSCMNFYAYRMMSRQDQCNHLLKYRMLLNQFWVDQYAKIESERLAFIRCNQRQLRVENYVHLQDALEDNEHAQDVGQLMILPSSFTGGPRYMHERTQDAMTYVRNYGKPDLFITFTCNPNWQEIKDNLFPHNTPQDRYDIVNRVFHLKIQKLMTLINKDKIFGNTRCFMYTVEWQKRGLPHVHLLLWLLIKIRPDNIDSVISAEIPDPITDPELHASVLKHMIHGPCGHLNQSSPCMQGSECTKKYPKNFLCTTSTSDDGYPKYRRRHPNDGGRLATIRSGTLEIDNRWIVPYNPVLLRIFDAHINVELCSSIKSIKYVCKYINKGSDQATFTINSTNEVEQFLSGRYISTSEAVWRILSFGIHERSPTVVHLAVHLENGQRVYFTPNNVTDIIMNPRDTTLTGFFKLCTEDTFARTLLYSEVPSYYTWSNNKFQRRKQGIPVDEHPGIKKSDALGRVYTVHPNNAECYHLRLLLHVIRGPTSFNFLRTVDGIIQTSFQSACKALGLLEDDSHWDNTLREASVSTSSSSMRSLFAVMLTFCNVSDPLSLWLSHRESMSEDILHSVRTKQLVLDLDYNEAVFNTALIELEKIVQSISGKSAKDMGLPLPDYANDFVLNREYLRETSYDRQELRSNAVRDEESLNSDQRTAYNIILLSAQESLGKVFFLDAPGGTGKTFLINLLLAKLRSEGLILLQSPPLESQQHCYKVAGQLMQCLSCP